MKITISFHQLEHTDALDKRIKLKSKRFEKFLEGRTEIRWNCYVKSGVHYAEIDCVGPQIRLHAKGSSLNLYKSFDQAVDKLESQLRKRKEKWKNNIHKAGHRKEELVCLDPEVAWTDAPDLEIEDEAI